MPLTSAIQSAMAIRHEREKRHQRRLSKIRRESGVGFLFHRSLCYDAQSENNARPLLSLAFAQKSERIIFK